MTLLEELQARIQVKSDACGRPFPLGAATLPSNPPRPEESSALPLGLSSNEPCSQSQRSASKVV